MKKEESAAPVSISTGLYFALFEPGYRTREAQHSLAATASARGARDVSHARGGSAGHGKQFVF